MVLAGEDCVSPPQILSISGAYCAGGWDHKTKKTWPESLTVWWGGQTHKQTTAVQCDSCHDGGGKGCSGDPEKGVGEDLLGEVTYKLSLKGQVSDAPSVCPSLPFYLHMPGKCHLFRKALLD